MSFTSNQKSYKAYAYPAFLKTLDYMKKKITFPGRPENVQ